MKSQQNVTLLPPFVPEAEAMQTLLIISASAFAFATLVWFSTWALWIHPPEGWIGRRIVSVMPLPETDAVRHAVWFRWLKIVTLLLGLSTLALFGMMVAAHS
jgi:hypothetical protein